MSSKTDTEVIIGGKVFTLSGYESEEYLQKVASYINNKANEYGKVESFKRQPLDTQSVLLQLNIADDYFKAKKQVSILEEQLQTKETEMYDLKHELISAQIKLENSEKKSKESEAGNDGLKREADDLKQENDKLKKESGDLKQTNDKLKKEANDLRQENGRLKKEVDRLKQATDNNAKKITQLEAELKEKQK